MKQQNNENTRTAFLLYEPRQVEELERLWREQIYKRAGSLVIALSLDTEMKLTERGIVFSSGRRYKRADPNLLITEDKMMEAFFSDPRWAAFKYRGVNLQTAFLFPFRAYLQRVWYYGNLLISIIESHPSVKLFVLFAPSGVVLETSGVLAKREVQVVIDCAKIVAVTGGIQVSVIPSSRSISTDSFFFSMRRALFGFLLVAWNAVITVLHRPSRPRLLISDYWRNVGPSIELLKEAECIFIDRTEIRHIPWRALLRHRMRFVHTDDFLSRNMRIRARESAHGFIQQWNDMRNSITAVFVCRGYSFDPLLLNAVDDIALSFEKLICEIEGTYALYTHLHPDVVLLRASVSGQTHFSILPLVAKNFGIPSLELQHGIEYLGPGSWSREHAAEYLAVYGSLVKKELLSIGYMPEKVREIGSPRFDSHCADSITSTTQKFTVLCVAPDIRPFEIYDSYSAEDYFNAVARVVESLGDMHVIIKLRSGPANEGLLRSIIARAFSNVSHTIAQNESLRDLFAKANMVVSCFSTAILEALQCDMPIIIPALNPIDTEVVHFHFSHYRDANALHIVLTHKEFAETLALLSTNLLIRNELRAKIKAFLISNFCFDGNSSQRLASLIKELAHLS